MAIIAHKTTGRDVSSEAAGLSLSAPQSATTQLRSIDTKQEQRPLEQADTRRIFGSKEGRKKSRRIPSDCVITSKVLIYLLRQMHTDAVEDVIEAGIQELDDRVGDCDLEPDYDCGIDDEMLIIDGAGHPPSLKKPRTATVLLPIIRQRLCPT